MGHFTTTLDSTLVGHFTITLDSTLSDFLNIFCFIKSTYNQQFNLLNQSYATLIYSLNHFVDRFVILLKILSSKLKPHMLIPTVNSRIVDIGIA